MTNSLPRSNQKNSLIKIFSFALTVISIIGNFSNAFAQTCRNANLEMAAGVGNTTASGPSVANQVITFQNNSNDPSGNTYTAFAPALTATYEITNQVYTTPYQCLNFGAGFNSSPTTLAGMAIYSTMNGISGPTNAHFTSSVRNAAGTGIDVTSNKSIFFATNGGGLNVAGLPTTGRYEIGTFKITFSAPVDYPLMHITGLGGIVGALGITSELECQTPGITLTKLSGSAEMVISGGTKILNGAATPGPSTGAGAASGTVSVNALGVTTLTFKVFMRSNGTTPTWGDVSAYPSDAWLLGFSIPNFVPAAPTPTALTISNTCPTTTVNLNSLKPAAIAKTSYEWHSGIVPTAGNLVSTPTAAAPGTYYLFSKDSITGCISAASNPVVVNPISCVDTDGDGIIDYYDIDDDNDGVTDVLECPLANKVQYVDFAGWPAGTSVQAVPYPAGGNITVNTVKSYKLNGAAAPYVHANDANGAFPRAFEGLSLAGNYAGAAFSAEYNGYVGTLTSTNALNLLKTFVNTPGTYEHEVELNFTTTTAGKSAGGTVLAVGGFYPDALGWDNEITITAYKPGGILETNYSGWKAILSDVNTSQAGGGIYSTPWQSATMTPGGIVLDPSDNPAGYSGTQDARWAQIQAPSNQGYEKIIIKRRLIAAAGYYDYEYWSLAVGYESSIGECDTDHDGIANTLDPDSDNDGCSDAFESGTTSSLTANFTHPGPYGANGLQNTLEVSDAFSTTTINNYTTKYNLRSVDSSVNACIIVPSQTCGVIANRAEEKNWFFSNAALDFGTTGTTVTPSTVSGMTTGTTGGTISITNAGGQLMFYGNANTIYNVQNTAINSTAFTGTLAGTQPVAAFMSPTDSTKYFVITSAAADAAGQLYFHKIDMTGNGGLGSVISQNTAFGAAATNSEAVLCVPNNNGTKVWVLSFKPNTNEYNAYLFDGNGYTGTVVTSNSTSKNLNHGNGVLRLSPDGTKVLALSCDATTATDSIREFTFNAATGDLIELWKAGITNTPSIGAQLYSADYSPSGNYVYLSGTGSVAKIFRYDIASHTALGTFQEITSGATAGATNLSAGGGMIQRGPDGKMYCANTGATSIATVSTPDAATPTFTLAGQSLSTKTSTLGLPQTVGNCSKAFPDNDNDGVSDLVDIDDDNDGVLDLVENDCPIYKQDFEGADWNVYDADPNYLPGVCLNGQNVTVLGTKILFHNTGGCTWPANAEVWGTSTPINVLANNSYKIEFQFYDANNVFDPQLEVYANGVKIGGPITPDVTGGFDKKSFTWNSGSSTTLDLSFRNASTGGTASGADFGFDDIKVFNNIGCDADGDGIANAFDLDSDGDGCSDAFEAGTTSSTTANYAQPGPYGVNGLQNSLEVSDVVTTATINDYSLKYNLRSIDANINACIIIPSQNCGATANRAEEKNWFFGTAQLDFGTTGSTVTPLTTSALLAGTTGGTISITNKGGQLLFYGNANKIYNVQNTAINATAFTGNADGTQSVAAFMNPGDSSQYYVVTSSALNTGGQLYYHRVDMTGNGGLGSIVSQNTAFGAAGTASEAVLAVPNNDGSKVWVITFKPNDYDYNAYLFDANGYTGTFITSFSTSKNINHGNGALRLSPDGTKILALSCDATIATDSIREFTFNAATGDLIELWKAGITNSPSIGTAAYSADYSPSGNYAYVSGTGGVAKIFRYDITAHTALGTFQEITSGATAGATNLGTAGGQILRGPDGKMYCANTGATSLATVTNPDAATPTFTLAGQALAAKVSTLGLPQTVGNCSIAFPDFDNDGVSNLVDIDDDNDGVLDVVEVCSIAPTSKSGVTISTDLTLASGTIATLLDGTDNVNQVYFNGQSIVNKSIFRFDLPTPQILNYIEVSQYNNNVSSQLVAGSTYKIQGSNNGTTWTDITPVLIASGNSFPKSSISSSNSTMADEFSFDNSTFYSKYRVYGVSGTVTTIWMQEAYIGSYCTLAMNDNDNDGIPNDQDLDSDGDGCSDAFEAGTTSNTTANYVQTGPYGVNGLQNSLEVSDVVTTATINDYSLKYNLRGIDANINACIIIPSQNCGATANRAEEKNWFFGTAQLDFGTTGSTVTPLTSSALLAGTTGGTISITNKGGQLLFYGNANKIYNVQNTAINATAFTGNADGTQSVAAFMNPSDSSKYFIVTSSALNTGGQLYYHQVDMSGNNGLGSMISQNIALGAAGIASEAVLAVPNNDGSKVWVISFKPNDYDYNAYLFDGNGYTGTFITSFSTSKNINHGNGTLRLSPDGTKILALSCDATIATDSIREFTFNAATGDLIELWKAGISNTPSIGTQAYSADYSPNGNYAYVSGTGGVARIFRYDISAHTSLGTFQEITSGATAGATNLGTAGGQILRGPDGKMYCANTGTNSLATVTNPDAATPTFTVAGQALAAKVSTLGLPQTVGNCSIAFPDNDNDGVSDIVDIDDDNDGVLDAVEVCTFTPVSGSTSGVTASSDLTPTYNAATSITNALFNGVDNTWNVYFPANLPIANVSLLRFDFPSAQILDRIEVTTYYGAPNPTYQLFANGAVYKIQASNNGTSWTDLTGNITYDNTAVTAPSADIVSTGVGSLKFLFTSNAFSYKNYRILGVSGTTSANLSYLQEAYMYSNCTLAMNDNDGDGIANDQDLDSDNDGCSDAFEAGTTSNSTANYAQPGPYGVNGLQNTLEVSDVVTTATINDYSLKYDLRGIDSTLNACIIIPSQNCGATANRAEEKNWFFGTAQLDFGTTGSTVTPFTTSALLAATTGGTISITNKGGQLLFYGNANKIYNVQNTAINATAFTGNPDGTQSVAAFMSPSDSSQYFVVTSSALNTGGQLYYHQIDMSGNGGLGSVVSQNTAFGAAGTASEAVLAVPNHDGSKVWVISFKPNDYDYNAYLFDGNGYTGTFITSFSTSKNINHGNGTLRLSPDGTKILALSCDATIATDSIREFTFNASTGDLIELWKAGISNSPSIGTQAYSADYSPNGNYAYVSGTGGVARIFRYDISAHTSLGTFQEITSGATANATNLGTGGGQILRGPDGKMYCANTLATSLATVTNPDAATPTFTVAGQALAAKASTLGLPQTVGNCSKAFPDFDNDGVSNLVDIDDDNDGVLDVIEACSIYQQPKTGMTVSSTITVSSGSLQQMVDGIDNATQVQLASNIALANQTIMQFDLPTPQIVNNIEITQTLGAPNPGQILFLDGSTFKVQGWDGSAWTDITNTLTFVTANMTAPTAGLGSNGVSSVKIPFLSNATSYSKYRIYGISGATPSNIPKLQEAYLSSNCTLAINDKDGDGISNDQDLDSDGDGCSDAFEAGTTSNNTANYAQPGPYGVNGLQNTLEVSDVVTTATINDYSLKYNLRGIDSTINACNILSSQNCGTTANRTEEKNWFFGTAQLDFGTTGSTVTPVTTSALLAGTTGGTISITNKGGQLMFYGNANKIYNVQNTAINATAFTGNADGTQAVAAFMSPTDSSKYFVVTSSALNTGGQLYFHQIDMSANNGLGGVISQNTAFGAAGTASEAVLAVPNNDGSKVWVISFKPNDYDYNAYLFDGNGYTGTFITSFSTSKNINHGNGTLRLSPDGTKILALSCDATIATDSIREFTFNAATGDLIELWKAGISNSPSIGTQAYSADYSPNGNYAYVSGTGGVARIFRYDISAHTSLGTFQEITSGATASATNLGTGGGQILRGPDGKMYCANTLASSLATVTNPDAATPTFTVAGQALAGKASTLGLPQTVGNCSKGFPDNDNDGVSDLVDIDDDNDGVLDVYEVCTFQQLNKSGVTVTSSMGWNGNLQLLVDGADVTNQVYPNATTVAGKTILQFDFLSPTLLNTIELSAYSTQTAIGNGAVVSIQGWNGTSWVNISANQTVVTPLSAGSFNSAQLSYKFPMLSNATSYLKYRIQGVSGSLIANWLQEAYFAKTCSVAMNDTDNDGITNDKDLDSDGDGCSDAFEAGTTGNTIANYAQPGPYGVNGLQNTLEVSDVITTATINDYSYKYSLRGMNASINACTILPSIVCNTTGKRAEAKNWAFGTNAGLNFGASGTTVTPVTTNVASGTGGSISVTNAAGQLLFYGTGTQLYNVQNVAMTPALTGNAAGTQPIGAFMVPGDSSEYFVVTSDANNAAGQLYYSRVNMKANAGLGGITTSNIAFGIPAANNESVLVVPNNDGSKVWVISAKPNDYDYNAYLFDDGGYTGTVITSYSTSKNINHGNGTLRLSPDGTKILALSCDATTATDSIREFTFNAATGDLIELWKAGITNTPSIGTQAYSADYSPSGNYAYVSGTGGVAKIFRYDITAHTSLGTFQEITSGATNLGTGGGQILRGPDGKMYCANTGATSLATVTNPDAATPTFTQAGQTLSAKVSTLGLPQTIGNCSKGMADFDGDGVNDIVDIDDDNDGVLDAIEVCSRIPVSKTDVIVSSSVQWVYNNGATSLNALVDGVDGVTYQAYPPALLDGETALQFDFPTPTALALIELGNYPGQSPLQAGDSYAIQGWDGTNWVEIVASQIVANTAPIAATNNSIKFDMEGNMIAYSKYRILGISLTGVANWAQEAYFFGPCTLAMNDADNDGIPNDKDLDSDGDGCSDAFEAGTTSNTTANYAQTGPYGVNGLHNPLEVSDVVTTATINDYSLKYNLRAQNAVINACNVLVSQNCGTSANLAEEKNWMFGTNAGLNFGISGGAPTAVTTNIASATGGSLSVTNKGGQLMFYGTANQLYNAQNVAMTPALTGNAAGTQPIAAFMSPTDSTKYFVVTSSAVDATAGQLYFSRVDMTANNGLGAITTANTAFGLASTASEAVLCVPNNDGSKVWVISFKQNDYDYNAYLFDGNGYTGTVITSYSTSKNLNHSNGTLRLSPDGSKVLALSCDAGTGTDSIREFTFNAATGDLIELWKAGITNTPSIGAQLYSADYSPSGNYAYLSGTGGVAKIFRYDITAHTSLGAFQEITSGATAGATNLGTGGGKIQRGPDGVMYCANTGASSLATVTNPDAATPTFTVAGQSLSTKISTSGLPQTVGNCTKSFPDFDNDGVNDVVDIDDDNDGVLDVVEVCSLVPVSKTGVTVSSTIAPTTGTIQNTVNGTETTDFYYTATTVANKTIASYSFPAAVQLNQIYVTVNAGNFLTGATYKVQGSNDGTVWTDLTGAISSPGTSSVSSIGFSANPSMNFSFSSNSTSYITYRILGLSGSTNTGPWVYEAYFFANCSLAMNDKDGDGIPNDKDLDSDGDGCSDAFEAGTTGSTTANFVHAGPYGNNGLQNTLEVSDLVTTATINDYATKYTVRGLNNTINACTILVSQNCGATADRAEEKNWTFGNLAGLDFDFSGTIATPVTTNTANGTGGSLTVTNSGGQLMFYGTGTQLYNAQNVAITPALTGNAAGTQPIGAFMSPIDSTKYIVVTSSAVDATAGQLYYSVIDMQSNNGLGAYVTSNTAFGAASSSSEAVLCVPNNDGSKVWVISFKPNSYEYNAYLFDGNGYTGTLITSYATSKNLNHSNGTLRLSPDGKNILALSCDATTATDSIREFRFNAATGDMIELWKAGITNTPSIGAQAYSADYSPIGNYAYVSGLGGVAKIFRYNISSHTALGTFQEITSGASVGATNLGAGGGQISRGPDGNMYCANNGSTSLAIVTDPDLATPAFVQAGQSLSAKVSTAGLPQTVGNCTKALPDFDGDGVNDLVDIDDDNDGVLDNVECPSEITTNGNFTGGTAGWVLTGGWGYSGNAIYDYNDAGIDLATQTVNGLTGPAITLNAAIRTNGYGNVYTSGNTATLRLSIGGVKYVDFVNPSGGTLATATAFNGATVSLSSFPISTTSGPFTPITITIPWVSQPSSAVLEWLFTANGDDWGIDYSVIQNGAGCDDDGDGISNDKDLDSDNDGCSDAFESSATILYNTNYTFPGPYGANGFADAKETVPGNGIANYTTTYSNATDSATHTCPPCPGAATAPLLGASSVSNTCPAATVDLINLMNSATPSGTQLIWYTNNTHTAPSVANPSAVSTSGTYYAFYYDPIGLCYSPVSTAVVVTVIPCCAAGYTAPALSANTATNTCPSATANISNLVSTTTPAGSTLKWFTNNTHTGTAYATPVAATAGTYYAFFYDANLNCYSPASAAVTVTITPCCAAGTTAPSLSASSTSNVCPDVTVDLTGLVTSTVPVGTVVKWYTNNAHTGAALTNDTAVVAGTYYAFFFDAAVNCYSPVSSAVNVTINSCVICNAGSNAPVLSSTTLSNSCPAYTANIDSLVTSTAPATTALVWYTNASHTGAVYTTPTTAGAGTYYAFYVDATNNCYSPASSGVTVSINSCPIILTNVCPLETVNLVSSISLANQVPVGTVMEWHNATPADSTNKVVNPTAVVPGAYYAVFYDTIHHCYGATAAAVTFVPTHCCAVGPTAPTLSLTSASNSCPSNTVNLNGLVSSTIPAGTNVVWYTNNTHTGSPYATPTTAGSGTYYAFYYDSLVTCYSPASNAVSVSITSCVPANQCNAGTIAPTLNDSLATNVCPDVTADISGYVSSTPPAGTTVVWYKNNTATGTPVNPSAVIAGVYYAFYYDALHDCYSPASDPVKVDVTPCCTAGTIAPALSATSASNACPGTTVNLDALVTSVTPIGSTLEWYTDSLHSTLPYVNTTNALAGTYYAFYHDLAVDCFSPVSSEVTVTIVTCGSCNAGTVAPSLSASTLAGACGATTVDLTTLVTSTPPSGTTLVWYTNNSHTGTPYATPAAAVQDLYYVYYFDATNNCYSPAGGPVAVTIPDVPTAPTASVTSQPSCSVSTGTITITAPTGSGLTYSIDGTTYTNTTGIFTTVAAGTYNVTVQNASGCISSPTVVTVNAAPGAPATPTASVTSQPTCSVSTGEITITAPTGSGMTYSIDGISYTNTTGLFTSVAAGTYNVTAKNAAGCISTPLVLTVNAAPGTPATPTASVSSQPTCAVATGTITITAPTGSGMTYSVDGSTYTNTTGIFSSLVAGTYNVTAMNASGCVSSPLVLTVNAQPATPAMPTGSVTTQPTCAVPTGTIEITAPTATGMTYSIDGSTYTNTDGIFTSVLPGTYNVTAMNAAGCVSSPLVLTVNTAPGAPAAPTASVTAQPTCSSSTGTIEITAPTGAGMTYSIDGLNYTNTTGIFTSVAPGTYNLTAKNATGCVSSATSITVNAAPGAPSAPTASITQPTCSTATATINITAPTGTGMTYSMDGSTYTNTTGIFTGVTPGTYSLSAKDAGGCISTPTVVTINTQPSTPAAPTASVTSPVNCATYTGTITVTAPTGSGITYSINGSTYTNTTGVFTGVTAGTYNVTAMNASGCVSSPTVVTMNALVLTAPSLSATTLTATCPATSVNLTTLVTSTAPAGMYVEWYDNATYAGSPISPDTAVTVSGTYYAYFTDSVNNCWGAASAPVTVTIIPCIETNPDVNVTNINEAVTGDLSTNDNVGPGTTYGYPVPDPSNPSITLPTINANGTYSFTPTVAGKYNFMVPVCPSGMTINCPLELLTITVLNPAVTTNNPVANTDIATTLGTHPVVINVLSNDQSGNPGKILVPTTVVITTPPSHGTTTINATTGAVTYTPNSGFTGIDTMQYQVCDNSTPSHCNTAYVLVDVLPLTATNSVVANEDYTNPAHGLPASGNVLNNDQDPEEDNMIVTPQNVTIAGKGTLVLATNGDYTFIPNTSFAGGPIDFPYTVCDDGTPQACATATLHVLVAHAVPDLTPNITITPNVIHGITSFNVTVKVTELNQVTTNGAITVRIPKDNRVSFTYNSALTNIGFVPVSNSTWTYDGSNPFFYIFTRSASINGGSFSTFGFVASFNPSNTDGKYSMTSTISSGSGSEVKTINNTDSESADYFHN